MNLLKGNKILLFSCSQLGTGNNKLSFSYLWYWCDWKILFQRKTNNLVRNIKHSLLKVFNVFHSGRHYFLNSESFVLFSERTDSLTDMSKQEPKAEEEQLSSQLEKPQESIKAAAGHKEMLPVVSEKEPNPPKDEKHVAGQDMPEPAAEQAASEEVEREQFLSYDDKQDDLLPGKAGL